MLTLPHGHLTREHAASGLTCTRKLLWHGWFLLRLIVRNFGPGPHFVPELVLPSSHLGSVLDPSAMLLIVARIGIVAAHIQQSVVDADNLAVVVIVRVVTECSSHFEVFVHDLVDQVLWHRINVSEDICCGGEIGEETREGARHAVQVGHASHDGLELSSQITDGGAVLPVAALSTLVFGAMGSQHNRDLGCSGLGVSGPGQGVAERNQEIWYSQVYS
jgi:hypothetical protein